MRFQKVKSQSKRKEETMGLFTGVDLHSNNGYYGIINKDEERIFKKKFQTIYLLSHQIWSRSGKILWV